MITVKRIYENGDTITTRINGTFEDAQAYFLNRIFNLGTGADGEPEDNMQKCIKVERPPMGMIVSVFKEQRLGDCTNHGISSTVKQLTVIGEGIPQMYEPSEDAPGVKLVRRKICGNPYIHCEPLDRPTGSGWMMGGNFIYSCDSRFGEVNNYPIPIHDRQEFNREVLD
jgi:hypothetical protein